MVSGTLTMMKRRRCGSLRHLLDNMEPMGSCSSHIYWAGTSIPRIPRTPFLSDSSGSPTAVHSHHLRLHDLPLLAFSELKEIKRVAFWQSTEDEGRKIS